MKMTTRIIRLENQNDSLTLLLMYSQSNQATVEQAEHKLKYDIADFQQSPSC